MLFYLSNVFYEFTLEWRGCKGRFQARLLCNIALERDSGKKSCVCGTLSKRPVEGGEVEQQSIKKRGASHEKVHE
jgi:hypothetical protein